MLRDSGSEGGPPLKVWAICRLSYFVCPPKAHRGMVKKEVPHFFLFFFLDGVDHRCIHKTVHVQDKDHI